MIFFLMRVLIDELVDFQKVECLENTARSTEWACRNFDSWRMVRNDKHSEKCPDYILESADRAVLCEWLCKYISETRKADGTEYTPHSLYLLLSGIQRKIRCNHPIEEISIFNDPAFKPLKNVCNSVFKRQKGYWSR